MQGASFNHVGISFACQKNKVELRISSIASSPNIMKKVAKLNMSSYLNFKKSGDGRLKQRFKVSFLIALVDWPNRSFVLR